MPPRIRLPLPLERLGKFATPEEVSPAAGTGRRSKGQPEPSGAAYPALDGLGRAPAPPTPPPRPSARPRGVADAPSRLGLQLEEALADYDSPTEQDSSSSDDSESGSGEESSESAEEFTVPAAGAADEEESTDSDSSDLYESGKDSSDSDSSDTSDDEGAPDRRPRKQARRRGGRRLTADDASTLLAGAPAFVDALLQEDSVRSITLVCRDVINLSLAFGGGVELGPVWQTLADRIR